MSPRTNDISLSQVPHLSLVAVSRNDDHGGDMLGRMQHFVNGFIAQCRKHDLAAELILVEWNPPPDRPPLADVLKWPDEFGPATVRVITVPAAVHAGFPHAAALPLFQMIGKNVGIRRARGRYVLATNVDILLDDETVIYLRDRLTPGTMLRADRYDVPGDLAKGVPFDRVLAECQSRFFQINTRFGIFDVRWRRFLGMGNGIQARLLALWTEIGIFGLGESLRHAVRSTLRFASDGISAFCRFFPTSLHAWRTLPRRIAKAFGGIIHFCFWAVRNAPTFLGRNIPKLLPLRTMPSRGYWYVRRILRRMNAHIGPALPRPLRNALGAVRWFLRKIATVARSLATAPKSIATAWRLMGPAGLFQPRSLAARRLALSQRLHTNGCGDFTLLAREDWFRLRGYPEWPVFSWHIDSVFLFAASAHDMKQVALDPAYRIFHIDHSVGSGWSVDGAAQLFARLDRKGIPYLTDDDVARLQKRFASDPATAIVNEANWGLGNIELPEHEVQPEIPAESSITSRRQTFHAASAG